MTDLIASLGKSITQRWLSAIVLPGLLYVALAGWAVLAGHAHALDLPYLARQLDNLWQHGQSDQDAAAAAAALAGILAAAGLTGVVTTVLAEDVVHRLWAARGPRRWRERRRNRTSASWEGRDPQPPRRYLPQRATAIGERFRLIGERVHAQYGLSATAAWPRIWVLASTDTRLLISTAHQRYYSDAALAAWGLIYLPWAMVWWPAALIAVGAIILGQRRAYTSSATLVTLIEATIDTHTNDLAHATGVQLPEGRLTPAEGVRINAILAKRA